MVVFNSYFDITRGYPSTVNTSRGCCSLLTFSWVGSLISEGYQREKRRCQAASRAWAMGSMWFRDFQIPKSSFFLGCYIDVLRISMYIYIYIIYMYIYTYIHYIYMIYIYTRIYIYIYYILYYIILSYVILYYIMLEYQYIP